VTDSIWWFGIGEVGSYQQCENMLTVTPNAPTAKEPSHKGVGGEYRGRQNLIKTTVLFNIISAV
jgi:hypothetical protein